MKKTNWRERVRPAAPNTAAQAAHDAAVHAGLLKPRGRMTARRAKRKPADDRA